MRMNYKLALYPLILLLSFAFMGCKESPINTVESPEKIKIESELVKEQGRYPFDYEYFSQISQVVNGNNDGDLLAFMHNNQHPDSEPYPALYGINLSSDYAVKMVEPESGFDIAAADLSAEWLIWVEKNKKTWKLYAMERKNHSKQIIDQGLYTRATGPDFPGISLHKSRLVYNKSSDDGSKKPMRSEIVFYDLSKKQTKNIASINADNKFLGTPDISSDFIVWHRGEWTAAMTAEVYCHDLSTGQTEVLSPAEQNAITPQIWDRYIVWASYSSDRPECKNICVYDRGEKETVFATRLNPSETLEYYNPQIAYGIVTWNNNLKQKPHVFGVNGELRQFDIEAEQIKICGSYMVWKNAASASGACLTSLFTWIRQGDMGSQYSREFITAPPFSLESAGNKTLLASLSPPEIVALREEAWKQERWDLVLELMAEDTGIVPKAEYVQSIKESAREGKLDKTVAYKVSLDYIVDRDKAYVGFISREYIMPGSSEVKQEIFSFKLHLTRQDGYWHVDQLAGQ